MPTDTSERDADADPTAGGRYVPIVPDPTTASALPCPEGAVQVAGDDVRSRRIARGAAAARGRVTR